MPQLSVTFDGSLQGWGVHKPSMLKSYRGARGQKVHAEDCPIALVFKYLLSLKDFGLTVSSLKVHLAALWAYGPGQDSIFSFSAQECFPHDHLWYHSGHCQLFSPNSF